MYTYYKIKFICEMIGFVLGGLALIVLISMNIYYKLKSKK